MEESSVCINLQASKLLLFLELDENYNSLIISKYAVDRKRKKSSVTQRLHTHDGDHKRILYAGKLSNGEDEEVLVIIKTKDGLDFYVLNDSTLNFKGRDIRFSELYYPTKNSQKLIQCGKIYNGEGNENVVGIVASSAEAFDLFAFIESDFSSEDDYPLLRASQVQFQPSLSPSGRIFIVKTPTDTTKDVLIQESGNKLICYINTNEPSEILKFVKKWEILLPPLLEDSVKNVLLSKGQEETLHVFVQFEDISVLYFLKEIGKSGNFSVIKDSEQFFFGGEVPVTNLVGDNLTEYIVGPGPVVSKIRQLQETRNEKGPEVQIGFGFESISSAYLVDDGKIIYKEKKLEGFQSHDFNSTVFHQHAKEYYEESKREERGPDDLDANIENIIIPGGLGFGELDAMPQNGYRIAQKSTLEAFNPQTLLDSVNLGTGIPTFSIPIESNLNLQLTYVGLPQDKQKYSVMGNTGWSLNPIGSYILRDNNEDGLQSSHRFFFVMDGTPKQLEFVEANSTAVQYRTKPNESNGNTVEARFTFHKISSSWEGSIGPYQIYFENQIKVRYSWNNLASSGDSIFVKFPAEWHLTRTQDESETVSYEYEHIMSNLKEDPQLEFTEQLLPKFVRATQNGTETFSAQFIYTPSNKKETKLLTKLVKTLTIAGYKSTQTLNFNYDAIQRLSSIDEKFDSSSPVSLFKFNYNEKGQLDSVKIPPLGFSTKLSYKNQKITWAEGDDLKTKFLEFDYPTSSLIAPLHLDQFGLSLFIMEERILLFSSADGTTETILPEMKRQTQIKKIQTCYAGNAVLILDRTESSTDVHVIEVDQKDNKLRSLKHLNTTIIPTTTLALMGCSIVTLDDTRNLTLWELDGMELVEKCKIKVDEVPSRPQFFVTSKGTASWLTGQKIYWSFLEERNGTISWVEPKSYGLSIPSKNYVGTSLATAMKLEGKEKEELENNLNLNMLQMNGNTLLLKSCELKPNSSIKADEGEGNKDRIYIDLNLLILDKKTGEIGLRKTYKLDKGSVESLKNSGNYGDIGVTIQSPTIITFGRNHTIKHNRDGWRLKENEKSEAFEAPLGPSFTIKKAKGNEPLSETPLQLCSKQSCESLSPRLSNFFPNYLVISNVENIEIIQFAQNGFNHTEIVSRRKFNERLDSHLSTSNFLVTRPILPYDGNSIRFRLIRPPESIAVVCSIKIDGGNSSGLQRTRGYEYHSPNKVGNRGTTSFKETIFIPGDDKSSFGWYECDNTNPSAGVKLFNAVGTYVKHLRKKDDKKDERDENVSLYDYEGRFVTETIPFGKNTSDVCNLGFLGFELDPLPLQPSCSPWNFPKGNVDVRGFSLTGQNFLRLSGKEQLTKDISLSTQMNYVISSWVRIKSQVSTQIEAPLLMKLEFLHPTLSRNVSILSKIQMKRERWLLLQIHVDMKNNLLPLVASINPQLAQTDSFNCKLVISPAASCKECSSLDVDHVVFGSTLWRGLVHVYPSKGVRQKPSQKLFGASGLFSNYWDGGDAVLESNGRGFVEKSFFKIKQSGAAVGLTGWVKVSSALEDGGGVFDFDSLEAGAMGESNKKQFSLLPNNQLLFEGKGANSNNFEIPLLSPNTNSFSVNIDYKVIKNTTTLLTEGGIAISAFGQTFFESTSNNTLPGESKCKVTNQSDGSIFLAVLDGGKRLIVSQGDKIICDKLNQSQPQSIQNQANTNKIKITLKGTVLLYRILKVDQPQVEISWANQFGESIQSISILDSDTIRVKQVAYDEVGRTVLQTKSTLLKLTGDESSALSFRSKFVTKFDSNSQSIEGEVKTYNPNDGGLPFYFTVFEPSPTKDAMIEGRPGSNYGILSKLASRIGSSTNHSSILTLFPPEKHIYKVQRSSGGFTQLDVMDLRERLVGVAGLNENGDKNKLATYDYDDQSGKLVSVLPPTYHESLGTLRGVKSWEELKKPNFTTAGGPHKWETNFEFDAEGRMTKRTTPDSGTDEFYFLNTTKVVKHSNSNEDGKTLNFFYFEYDSQISDGNIVEMGRLVGNFSSLPQNFNLSNVNVTLLMQKVAHKVVDYTGFPNDQTTQHTITSEFHNSLTHTETVTYDYKNRIVSRSTLKFLKEGGRKEKDTQTKFTYHDDSVTSLTYPLHNLKITYTYDRLGQMKRLSISKHPKFSFPPVLVEYEYGGSGTIREEKFFFQNNSSNKTKFEYNSPGFLTAIKSPGFQQNILYEEAEGYGDTFNGRLDSVMSTTFKSLAKNEEGCVNAELLVTNGIEDESVAQLCLSQLSQNGYLSPEGRVLRLFHPEHNTLKLPLSCVTGPNSAAIEKSLTSCFLKNNTYGMRYQYGTHHEMLKAKFYDPSDSAKECGHPLTMDALTDQFKNSNVSLKDVPSIWRKLRSSGFILLDTVKGVEIGKKGTLPFLNLSSVHSYLVKANAIRYISKVETLLPSLLSEGRTPNGTLSEDKLNEYVTLWSLPFKDDVTSVTAGIIRALHTEGILTNKVGIEHTINATALFNPEFIRILPTNYLHLWKALTSYLSCRIGTNSQDYEAVEADLNGNMKLIRNGPSRTKLTYKKDTNLITDVEIDGLKYSIGHDDLGSLSSWTQLNADGSKSQVPTLSLIYDPLIARPILAELNGLILKFAYDFKGERVLKQVWTKGGTFLQYQLEYLGRDSKGRVLVEREQFHTAPSIPPKIRTTTYFYGPRGLTAFLRGNKLFNVLTDNVGSIRQVIHDGEIQVEYHYGPYGNLQLLRLLGDPEGDLNYRFSGHEWDPHLQLYNFHFRLYDPKLGRFYQTDPEDQFFSPYVYAGNSPIIWVDPDGREFVLTTLLVISAVTALIGAYAAAAAANNRPWFWNWDWTSPGTYFGIVVGGVLGGLLPSGFSASVAALVGVGITQSVAIGLVSFIGVGGTYLITAKDQKTWKFYEWDYSSPKLYNSLFQGFAIGSGLLGGVQGTWKVVTGFTSWGKALFGVGAVIGGVGFIAVSGAEANGGEYNPLKWDYLSPATVVGVLVGGITIGVGAASAFKGVHGLIKNVGSIKPGMLNQVKAIVQKLVCQTPSTYTPSSWNLKSLGKTGATIGGVLGVTYLGVASTNNQWDFYQFKWRDASTHNAIISNLWAGLGYVDSVPDLLNHPSPPAPSPNQSFMSTGGSNNQAAPSPNQSFMSTGGSNNQALTPQGQPSSSNALSSVPLQPPGGQPSSSNALSSVPLQPPGGQPSSSNALSNVLLQPPQGQLTSSNALSNVPLQPPQGQLTSSNALSNVLLQPPGGRPTSLNSLPNVPRQPPGGRPTSLNGLPNVPSQPPGGRPTSLNGFPNVQSSDGSRSVRSIREVRLENEEDMGMRFWDNYTLGKRHHHHNHEELRGSSSSGASSSKQGLLLRFASTLKDTSTYYLSKLGPAFTSTSKIREEFVTERNQLKEKKLTGREKKKSSGEYKPHNCVPWVRRGDEKINGITCYDSNGILELIPKEGLISGGSLSYHSDTFADCSISKTSVGIGQASCSGHKVNMIYTTWEGNRGENILDAFNTQALFWTWVVSYFKVFPNAKIDDEDSSGEKIEAKQNYCREEDIRFLQRHLDRFKEELRNIRYTGNDSFLSDWILHIVSDLEERIGNLSSKSCAETVQEIMEDLAVVKEELHESLEPYFG